MSECGERCSRCFCVLPTGHETPHVCACGGSYAFRGEDGKELHVYALPSGSQIRLSDEEALSRANELARRKPILIEDRPPDDDGRFVFRASRELIKFLRIPPELTKDG